MKNSIIRLISIIAASSMFLSACAGADDSKSDSSQTTTTASQTTAPESRPETTTTTTAEPEQEEDYMKQFENTIVELPPEGYDQIADGAEYPAFKKYTYYSSTAERDTNVNVLLPRNYSEDKEYPVLYILHGYYDNEDWMARKIVGLNVIYNNLVSAGEAEEMIIVLPYIFCDKNMPHCTGMDMANNQAYDNFINDLTTDLMPFIESEFSVAKGRENTAITGFSMGGRESLYIGFEHPDKFGYIGSCCTAPGLVGGYGCPLTEEKMKFDEENKPFVLLMSSSNSDGVVGSSPLNYRVMMKKNGVDFLTHTMQSTGHDHSSVKPHLYNFMKMLFK